MTLQRTLSRNARRYAPAMLAAALLTAPAAWAQDPAPEGESSRAERVWQRLSERYDQNKDGQITADEVSEADRFARMDRNGDQVVTEADFEGIGERRGKRGHGPMHHMKKAMRAADADQDRQVTSEEWSAFVAGIDADGDGLITDEEITAHRAARAEADGASSDHAKGPRPGAKAFMDADGDGRLETEDLNAAFTKLDRNGDGVVSEDDRPRNRFRGKRRPQGHRLGGHLMRQADINEDQKLTQQEWSGYLTTLDSNTDGLLSFEELEAARPDDAPAPPERPEGVQPPTVEVSHLNGLFAKRDTDANGVIEGDEWNRRRGPRGERKRFRGGEAPSESND